jgi:hypothetical protein
VNIEAPDGAALSITGAGDADYLDGVSEELKECFFQHWREDSKSIEEALKQQLHSFYEKHVIPFAQFPDADRPSVALIVGLQKNQDSLLFITNKSVMRSVYAYEAVGVGAELAKTLLQRLYPKSPTSDVVEALVAYVTFQVKESIPYCGKETTIVRLQTNRADFGSKKRTRAMEELFRAYLEIERNSLGYIFGSPTDDFVKHLETSYKKMQKEIESLFKKFPNEKIDTVLRTTRSVSRKSKGRQ